MEKAKHFDWLKSIIGQATQTGVTELEVVSDKGPLRRFHLKFGQPTPSVPATTSAPAEPTERPSLYEDEIRYHHLKAPLTGIFYPKPGPDKPPFISEGGFVEEGQTVAIIETMKIMNELPAPVAGRIVKIVAKDKEKEVVYQDDTLFIIDKTQREPTRALV